MIMYRVKVNVITDAGEPTIYNEEYTTWGMASNDLEEVQNTIREAMSKNLTTFGKWKHPYIEILGSFLLVDKIRAINTTIVEC